MRAEIDEMSGWWLRHRTCLSERRPALASALVVRRWRYVVME